MQPKTQITVAIVDDDQFLRESLRDFFDAMGIDSVAYESADAFLESGDLDRMHCILADLKMPGTNGIELLRKVVAMGGPPVCIMTSFADSHTRGLARSCGAAGFLEKPISSADLLEFISKPKRG
ncbi:response regulator transcription factor [Rhizobium mayense]|uniref:Response regulator n=1 Tax=Rhizobium mayense TaxID=1312184 RepID=A0ABT7JT94_9HYPH|nr:response regulator [Rhizobium mayense]MDL2398975.1 response regulator [Rhizobium mayense]